jgi:hypothetical protein
LQTTVFRYKEIGDILCIIIGGKVMFLSKYSLDINNTMFSMFRTQYIYVCTPDFFVPEHYGLQNTTSCLSKDLASDFTSSTCSGTVGFTKL